jgi:hypothetical protein
MGIVSLRYDANAANRVQVMQNTSGCRIWLHERETASASVPDVRQRLPEQEVV